MSEAQLAKLAEEIKDLSDAVASLKKTHLEATQIRNKEKAENTAAIQDAKDAQIAVERATQVLREFYGKSAQASLLQNAAGLQEEMAVAAKAPYNGMGAAS